MQLFDIEQELKKQISKLTETRGNKFYFDFEFEIERKDFCLLLTGELGIDSDDIIDSFHISGNLIQFSDFQAKLKSKSVKAIEKLMVGQIINY